MTSLKCYNCEMRYEHLQHVSKRRELAASIEETKSKFNSESEEAKKYKDFVSRTQILKAYSFMDEDQTLLLKGKVAGCSPTLT